MFCSSFTVSGSFSTSTPIKTDKENLQREDSAGTAVSRRKERWSPNILRTGRRHLLKEANDVSELVCSYYMTQC